MTVKRWLSARLHVFVILLSRFCDWLATDPAYVFDEEFFAVRRRKQRNSRHAVEQVTWNDDGTMTLVIRGHVEPVRNGDFVVYVKT